MRRIQAAEIGVLVGIIFSHGPHDTVFQSTGNLGIMVALAQELD